MHTLFHCIYTKNIAVFGRFVNLFFQKPILFIQLLVSSAARYSVGEQRNSRNLIRSAREPLPLFSRVFASAFIRPRISAHHRRCAGCRSFRLWACANTSIDVLAASMASLVSCCSCSKQARWKMPSARSIVFWGESVWMMLPPRCT